MSGIEIYQADQLKDFLFSCWQFLDHEIAALNLKRPQLSLEFFLANPYLQNDQWMVLKSCKSPLYFSPRMISLAPSGGFFTVKNGIELIGKFGNGYFDRSLLLFEPI